MAEVLRSLTARGSDRGRSVPAGKSRERGRGRKRTAPVIFLDIFVRFPLETGIEIVYNDEGIMRVTDQEG